MDWRADYLDKYIKLCAQYSDIIKVRVRGVVKGWWP